MSDTSQERAQRPKFRLFIPGIPKTYKEAAAERLVQVSQAQNNEEDDPCLKRERKDETLKEKFKPTVGNDPRFQQQNQTQRCFVMYTDFFRCEKVLGEGHEACAYFQDVYKAICPNSWIEHWDDLRNRDIMPWSKAYHESAEKINNRNDSQ